MRTAYSRGPLVSQSIDGDYYLERLSSVHEEELSSLISKDKTSKNFVKGESEGYFEGLHNSPGHHWVVMHGSPAEICGLVSVEEGEFNFCTHNIAVWIKPTHRGKGVGYDAVCVALNLAKDDGVKEVESRVHSSNTSMLYMMDKVCSRFHAEKQSRIFSDYQEWIIKLTEDGDGRG